MQYCDLHIHSTASDGTDPPENLPQLASDAGLAAFALTDHDTTAGLAACATAAEKLDITFVPGIELSADPASVPASPSGDAHAPGTLHLLGLFVEYDGPAAEPLKAIEQRLLRAREQRNPQMIQKLNDLGVSITYDEVRQVAEGNIVGRPHIAQVMLKKGYVKSIHEAFARYIGRHGAAYIRKDRLSAPDAIQAIHAAGGLAALAHPVQLGLTDADQLQHLVARLKDMGLDAIETQHPDHTPAHTQQCRKLADRYHLLSTGGSDYHGNRKTIQLASQRVPYTVYQTLDQHRRTRQNVARP